jgi:hypothetical protein
MLFITSNLEKHNLIQQTALLPQLPKQRECILLMELLIKILKSKLV